MHRVDGYRMRCKETQTEERDQDPRRKDSPSQPPEDPSMDEGDKEGDRGCIRGATVAALVLGALAVWVNAVVDRERAQAAVREARAWLGW